MPRYNRYYPNYEQIYSSIEIKLEIMRALRSSDRKMRYMERWIKAEQVSKFLLLCNFEQQDLVLADLGGSGPVLCRGWGTSLHGQKGKRSGRLRFSRLGYRGLPKSKFHQRFRNWRLFENGVVSGGWRLRKDRPRRGLRFETGHSQPHGLKCKSRFHRRPKVGHRLLHRFNPFRSDFSHIVGCSDVARGHTSTSRSSVGCRGRVGGWDQRIVRQAGSRDSPGDITQL